MLKCNLGSIPLADTVMDALEEYVCQLYQPSTTISRLNELRWWMFRREQAESNKLPPSKAAFLQSVKRALNLILKYHNHKNMVGNGKVIYMSPL